MLLISEIKIVLNRGNLGFYNKIMNNKYKVGDEIQLPIQLLPKTSKEYVDISCDVCKSENKVKYKNYNECLGYGFYTCNKCKHIKKKMTSLDKYGVENFNNNIKRKETMIDSYGFYNNNRIKAKETCIYKYGVDNVSQIDFVKKSKIKTNLKNWGVENVFQSSEIKNMSKYTNNIKYGFDYATQNIEIFNKAERNGYKSNDYKNLHYRGTYELDFLKFCEKNNIEVSNGPSIKFKYDNKDKVYHSDFFIEELNLICEIKSEYTYNSNIKLNLSKKDATLSKGYNFIFIIDKNYNDLLNYLT
jgi:hypothetical protein